MVKDPRGPILDAARLAFASRGYASTTVKSVAVAAGVAPAVVKSLFDNKEQLFTAAMQLPVNPAHAIPALFAQGLDGMGDRIVRLALTLMSEDRVRSDVGGVVQASPRIEKSARTLAEFMHLSLVDSLVTAIGVPDARMRVSLISSHLAGLAATRYVIRLEPLASASDDEIVRIYGPLIQDLLDPTCPLNGRR
ncbi:MAG: TetR family transcriptional regulator [Candidatus Nanopelagicales bacterium]